MTVSNASNKAGPYITNGVTTQFAFDKKLLQAADLKVYRTDILTGQEDLLSSGYSVLLINSGVDGATVTITPALVAGYKITLVREVNYLQDDYDPSPSSTYYAEVLEGAMDKRVMQIQQLKEAVDRAIKIPITADGVSPDLPAPVANSVIGSTDGLSYENLSLVDAGQAIAGNWTVDRFLAGVGFTAGVSTSVTLSKTPASAQSILVLFDGVPQQIHTYSVAAKAVNFTSAIPLGVASVEVRIPTTLAVGSPGDGAALDSCVVTATDGSVARTLAVWFADAANVKGFSAVGDGVTDDTAAISAAIATGKPVYFPAGTYLVTAQIAISSAKQCLFGDGPQSIIRRANAVGSEAMFTATGVSDLRFTSLRFEVASDTSHTQVGGFISASGCDNLTVDLCEFMCANGSGLPTLFSCVSTPSCNQVLINGNLFYRVYGNCCGGNDGVGSSVNGNHVIVSNNRIIDSIDTGIGSWTGAREVVIVGNVLTGAYTGVAYSKVGIDTAGASRVTVTGNSIDGYTIGVRVLTNLNYTNQDIIISSNVFGNHRTNTGEPAQAIKVSHSDYSGGGSPTASVSIVGNSFTLSGNPELGVDLISTVTDTTKKLTVRVDGNTFRKTGGTSYAILFQKLSSYGCLDIIPGENAFIGGVDSPTSGVMPDNRGSEVGGNMAVWMRSEFTLSGSTTTDFGRMFLKPGLYALLVTHGAMTDASGVGAYVSLETYPGAVALAGSVFAAVNQDTTWIPIMVHITSAGQYQFRWLPHPASNTHEIRSISFVRLM